jgi:dihydrofolate reductase
MMDHAVTSSVFIATSLDGFIATEDGGIDWLTAFQSPDVFRSYEAFLRGVDTIVIGRGTFEKVLTFPSWPYNRRVVVLSASLHALPPEASGRAELVSLPPRELLARLAGEGSRHLYVDGGKVIQHFLQEDCIDTMIITRVPMVLGGGIPLFGALRASLPFRHDQTETFANGLVQSRYTRRRSTPQ